MKVQEVLENYNIYKARISIAEAEIQELKNEMKDIKSMKMDGMPKAKGFTGSSLEETVINTEEKIEKKQRYINELTSKIQIVEDLVKTLKKYNQDIIIMRYYNKISIEEIATNKDRTYGAIIKTIEKSVEKMQREYNKNKKL